MKTKRVELRLSVQDDSRIRILAKIYADGDVTAWLTHGGLNAPRKYLKKKPARTSGRAGSGDPSKS